METPGCRRTKIEYVEQVQMYCHHQSVSDVKRSVIIIQSNHSQNYSLESVEIVFIFFFSFQTSIWLGFLLSTFHCSNVSDENKHLTLTMNIVVCE